jgi:transposase-like protein
VASELGLKKWTLAKWSQLRHSGAKRRGSSKGAAPSAATSEQCAALKREIEALGPRNPSRRFPEELKQRIAQWARGALEEAIAPSKIAEMIGVPWESLSRWLGRRAPTKATSKKLRAVRVVASPSSATRATPAGAVLKSPNGYVVDGLDVATLVEVLRLLG